MDQLLKVVGLGAVPYAKSRRDDDYADRMNHRTTVAILICFAVLVSTKQFVGNPINCWMPAHFHKDTHDEYTNSYCWIRNTYYLTVEEDVPSEEEAATRPRLPYYQWVPMILLLQALLFYLPYGVWVSLSSRSGVDIHSIVEAGQSFTVTDMTEIRDKTLMYMTMMMDRYLRCHDIEKSETGCSSVKRCLTQTLCRPCGRHRGNYLIITYLVIKCLYLVNVLGQLFLLDAFLGVPFHSYGVDVIRGIVKVGSDWSASPSAPLSSARFPRITMCDLKVRRLGAVHRYNVQCVLPINLFNEKIFLFVYFWMIFVAALTLYSLITWIIRFSVGNSRRRYVKQHLKFVDKLKNEHERKITTRKFVHGYLGEDGFFILRLVAHNTNTITVTEFVDALWDNFKNKAMVSRDDQDDVDV